MMMVSSPKGQALIDAYDAIPSHGEVDDEAVNAFLEAATEVVKNLREQGFRAGREGD